MSFDPADKYRNDPSMRAVSLGLDTEHFVTHDKVGRYLIERAQQCRALALDSLASVDPTNATAVLTLQWEAKVPELFLNWLGEAIANGVNAEEAIAQEEADSGDTRRR